MEPASSAPAKKSLAPAPPSSTSVVAASIPHHRRALAILLRDSVAESGSSGSTSCGLDGKPTRGSKRGGRTSALLKEIHSLRTIDEAVETESQLRNVILSNQVRQWNIITTFRLECVQKLEEHGIVRDQESRGRAAIVSAWSLATAQQFDLLHAVFAEHTARHQLIQQSSRLCPTAAALWFQIQTRRLRDTEADERINFLLSHESMFRNELFERYLMVAEEREDYAVLIARLGPHMRNKQIWLQHRLEERLMLDHAEYSARDELVSQQQQEYIALVGEAYRYQRWLTRHDVQSIEASRRTALESVEESCFHNLLLAATEERRHLTGKSTLILLELQEARCRSEIESWEAPELRSVAIEALRDWHRVHERVRSIPDWHRSLVREEQAAREDVRRDWRFASQELYRQMRERHSFVAQRDWETKHLFETYVDGRLALVQQERALREKSLGLHRRFLLMQQTASWASIIETEEATAREAIRSAQWTFIFALHIEVSLLQLQHRHDGLRNRIEEQERAGFLLLRSQFEAEAHGAKERRMATFVEEETASRESIAEHHYFLLLQMHRAFMTGHWDLLHSDVPSTRLLHDEAFYRQAILQQMASSFVGIRAERTADEVALEKKNRIAVDELTERLVLYRRIFEHVEVWCRGDAHYEEECTRELLEQHQLVDEERCRRIELYNTESTKFGYLMDFADWRMRPLRELEVQEMDERLSLIMEAEVAFNVDTVHSSSLAPKYTKLSSYALREERALRTSRSLEQDLEEAMLRLRGFEEPTLRHKLVVVEAQESARLALMHHEALMRDQIRDQGICETAMIYNDFFPPLREESTSSDEVVVPGIAFDSREALLNLLIHQEDIYREAEEQIKTRVIIEEGAILREYFLMAEKISSSEEVHRDRIWLTFEAGLVSLQVIQDVEEAEEDAVAAQMKAAKTSEMEDSQSMSILSASHDARSPPKPTFKATAASNTRRTLLREYAVVLHSIQLTIVYDAATEKDFESFRLIGNDTDAHTVQVATLDVAQRIRVGSKVLLVLQPSEEQRWSMPKKSLQLELSLRNAAGKEVGKVTRQFQTTRAENEVGVVSQFVSVSSEANMSGKANFLVEIC